MNSINLIGNIGNDIEMRSTKTGKSVCSFNLAVADQFDRDKTDWFTIVCWGKTAELVHTHLRKGSKVGITGRLSTRSYQDKSGNNRTAVEVVADNVSFVERKQSGAAPAVDATGDFEEIPDGDDLPF